MVAKVGGLERGPTVVEKPAEFAAALTQLREKLGLSIRQLSRTTNIPPATLGGYFSGRHLPQATHREAFFRLLRALGVTESGEQAQWYDALLRVRRGTRKGVIGEPGPAPYRGLKPFTEDSAGLFFGRAAVVDQLSSTVEDLFLAGDRDRIAFLVGPSGSGKSSVLRAGLAAWAEGRYAVAVLVPGTDPLGALSAASAHLDGQEQSQRLMIVDQAEEIFSPEVQAEDRQAFLRHITDLAGYSVAGGPAVVFGLRADFYGQATNEPLLLPALRKTQLVLGAMSAQEVREAIVRPAQACGVEVESALVDLVLQDVQPESRRPGGPDVGALPLISHALLTAWQARTGDSLQAADYVSVGGLKGAVNQSAEAVFGSFDASGQAGAQWLFTQMVLVDNEGAMTRRRVQHDALQHPDPATDSALDGVIEAFIAGRLLTAGDGTLEISHEALLTAWPRLYDWILEDLDAARLQSRISEAANLWLAHGEDPDLLLRGGPLLDAEMLAARPATSPRTLTAREQEFVRTSAARLHDEQRRERQRTRRLRGMLALTMALALVVSMAGVVGWKLRGDADVARDEAQAGQLAVTSHAVAARDPAAAAQLALTGYQVSPTVAARSSLLDSTSVPTPTRFVGPAGTMHAVSSPDGGLIASSGIDGVTRLWSRDGSGQYERLPDLVAEGVKTPGPVFVSAFAPDSRILAVADVDDVSSTILIWDLSSSTLPRLLAALAVNGAVKSLLFLTDDELISGTSAGVVQRWRLTAAGGTEVPMPSGLTGEVTALAAAPDRDHVIAGTSTGQIAVQTKQGWLTTPVTGAAGPTVVTAVAVSADGRYVASSQLTGDVRLWRLTVDGLVQRGRPFGGFTSWVNSVDYSADGTMLAAASSDGTVKLFSGRRTVGVLPTPSNATSVHFVGEGDRLLTSEVGGTARLWELPLPVLSGFDDAVWGVATDTTFKTMLVAPGAADGAVHMFRNDDTVGLVPLQQLTSSAGPSAGASAMSADGQWVAAGTADGRVIVWERQDGQYEQIAVLRNGSSLVENLAISPDGSLLAAVGDSSLLSIWKLRRGQEPAPVGEDIISGLGLAVTFNPAGTLVAVGTADNDIRLWSTAGAQLRPGPTLDGFSNYVYGLTFDPTGSYLAAGSVDQSIRIWDVSDPAFPVVVGEPLVGPGGTVYGLAWSRDGQTLAAASKDGYVWLWDVTLPEQPVLVATLRGPGGELYTAAFGAGDTVMAVGVDQVVTSWQTDVDKVAQDVCQRTGDPISEREWQQLVPTMAYVQAC